MGINKIAGLFFVVLGIATLVYAIIAYIKGWSALRRIGLSVASGVLFLVVGIGFLRNPAKR